MLKIPTSPLASHVATVLVWFALFASASFWVLQMPSERSLPAYTPQVAQAFAIDPAAVARALGGRQITATAQPQLAVRFVVRGIVAGAVGAGAALISVDGKPAQTFQVGGTVAYNFILRSTSKTQVLLGAAGSDGAIIRLNMPSVE